MWRIYSNPDPHGEKEKTEKERKIDKENREGGERERILWSPLADI
jgi:hypothetical protein